MADNDVTRIAGNIGAMNALYALTNINKQLSIHQTRLATGKRINSAADDPAGLAISTKMMSRSEGLKVALSNIGDAKNLLAVAESGLGRLTDILNSMRSITENAANDTNGTEERKIVKEQLASYANQINDIVAQTKWSDKKLIGGAYNLESAALTFQTGADFGETTKLYGLADMQASALSLLVDATPAVAATANVSAIGSNYTATLATVTGTELASGTYTVRTTVSGNASAGYTYSSNIMNGATVVATNTGSYSVTTGATINFGNGLSVALATGMAGTDAAVATVSTTAIGTGMTAAISALSSGVSEIASGTYSVNYTISAGGTATVVLMSGSTAMATSAVAYNGTDGNTINFGNGLSVDLAASLATGSAGTGTDFGYVQSVADTNPTTTSGNVVWTHSVAAAVSKVAIGEDSSGASFAADFSAYMSKLDAAMVIVNAQLSKIGSLTGSLTFKEDQVSSSQINIEASFNRIMNANMAEEQVNASKLTILQQTSTAMLAQANAAPQFLLSLFK